ncbi:MAG: lipoprotein-releasing ABC transporter permease subunit [bacterium]
MFKPLPLFIGLRYTRAKRRNHFISFISLISMLGIALGVTALITVLSVMNGFEQELREKILGMASHVKVSEWDGKLSNWQEVQQAVKQNPHVVGSAPLVSFEGMLNKGEQVSGALMTGIDPAEEPKVSDVGGFMKVGKLSDLKPGKYNIILGQELANTMGVSVGSKVTVITPQATVTPAGVLPRLRRFTVVGIFSVGMYEYDRGTAFVHMRDAAKLFGMGDKVSGLRLKLDDLFQAQHVSHELDEQLGSAYWISDWTQQHANFFKAVQTEKRVMFIILLLIVAVAAFNIVSTLVMLVTDKQPDIAILRTLGLTPLQVMGIFMVQGVVIGLLGTLIGLLCGVLLASNIGTVVPFIEQLFNTKFLSPDVYNISEVPSDLRWLDVAWIGLVSFVLTVVATLYPSWQASRTHPAEALRYE